MPRLEDFAFKCYHMLTLEKVYGAFAMNKIIKFSLALFCLALISCGGKRSLNDGTWTGSGEGRNGPVEVSVTVKDGEVADAKVLSEQETEDVGKPAIQPILDEFLQTGGDTSEVDIVSGATLTSDALLDALDAALDASAGIEKKKVKFKDTKCDIVIVGAGGAGLVAATEAASRGAKTIVLEKNAIVGGNTNSSTGGINASYTKEQARLGIEDSPDVFYEDTMRGGKNMNDPALVRTLVDNSAAMVDWLESDLVGADLSDVGIFGGATNKRIHRPRGGQAIGAHLVPLLREAAEEQGADIRLKSKVVEILQGKDGEAAGVKVLRDSNEYTIKAKAVIIATGGFGANPKMVEKYRPDLAGFGTTNQRGATGDAFSMLEKFDAATTQMEQIQTHPTVVPKNGTMITEAVRGNGAILIDKSGNRFVDEMQTRDLVSKAILACPEKKAFLVFDQGVRESLKAIENYAKHNLLTEAQSLDELSKKLGIDSGRFEKTIKRWNSFVAEKNDKDFGRNKKSMDRALDKAPYYAIEVEPAIHHTMGGLKINSSAQVMNKSGNVIPGLYAAGEVTGGVHGANRLGGNAVADICIFGKIAADSALEQIGK